MSALRDKITSDAARPKVTGRELEIQRITSLPVRDDLTPEEVEEVSRQEVQAHHFAGGFRLFDVQARAVVEWDLVGGLFGPIGVGWGKTLITLMIAARAYREGVERSLLVIPPDVYGQLVSTDIPWARDRVDLAVPFHYLGQRTREERAWVAKSNRRGCYVMPYSCLSTADSWDLLTAVRPQLVILDEVHNIKNRRSARTKRMLRFLEAQQPRLVAVSGTITDKSIDDYQHVVKHALGENSPLPLIVDQAMDWAAILDAEATPSEANAGPIMPLMEWARSQFPGLDFPPTAEGFRRAYRVRLQSCPGVVSTGDRDIGTSLVYHNEPVSRYEQHSGWEAVEQKIADVEDLWTSPSGDEIDYAIHKWAYLLQLNAGFYYRLFWPPVDALAARRSWSADEAAEMLEIAQDHHVRQQEYHRVLRKFLQDRHVPGMDTPMLVGQKLEAYRSGRLDTLPVWDAVYEAWRSVKEIEVEGMPERDREPVRLCAFKVNAAAGWADRICHEDGPGGLIWVLHQEMGQWVYETLSAWGLPCLHCPADSLRSGSDAAIRDPSSRDKFVVASIAAHGIGKNLQHHQHAYFAQWPRESTDAEQSVGRIHRKGQAADCVRIDTCNTTEFDHQNFASCLVDALYHQQTTGVRQRVIYGAHDPLPKVYPSGFLRENGFQNRQLSAQQERDLVERFGARR